MIIICKIAWDFHNERHEANIAKDDDLDLINHPLKLFNENMGECQHKKSYLVCLSSV